MPILSMLKTFGVQETIPAKIPIAQEVLNESKYTKNTKSTWTKLQIPHTQILFAKLHVVLWSWRTHQPSRYEVNNLSLLWHEKLANVKLTIVWEAHSQTHYCFKVIIPLTLAIGGGYRHNSCGEGYKDTGSLQPLLHKPAQLIWN
jgi:hypothetical protein